PRFDSVRIWTTTPAGPRTSTPRSFLNSGRKGFGQRRDSGTTGAKQLRGRDSPCSPLLVVHVRGRSGNHCRALASFADDTKTGAVSAVVARLACLDATGGTAGPRRGRDQSPPRSMRGAPGVSGPRGSTTPLGV